jgi:hypothetical protein
MEIAVDSVRDVRVQSELVSSGGGTCYRNRIEFLLDIEAAGPVRTELSFHENQCDVKLHVQTSEAGNGPRQTLLLAEDLDMQLEDFEHVSYCFQTSRGETRVHFAVSDGKVTPILS